MSFMDDALLVNSNQLTGAISLKRNQCRHGSTQQEAAAKGHGTVHVINGRVAIQFMCLDAPTSEPLVFHTTVLVSFRKLIYADESNYRLNFSSKQLNIDEKFITTADDGFWHIIHEGNVKLQTFDVNAVVEVIKYQSTTFSAIHDDTELTDFELQGVDGSVRVHRAVLAAASPVLRRMLSGSWREGAAGRVEVAATTRATLQHLKDYVYLGVLPASGLRPLLLLASCYMMPELETRCVEALVDTMTADTAYDLLEFAISNQLKELVLVILERVERGKVKVADIRAAPDAPEAS